MVLRLLTAEEITKEKLQNLGPICFSLVAFHANLGPWLFRTRRQSIDPGDSSLQGAGYETCHTLQIPFFSRL